MDDALGVNHHLNLRRRDAKKETRLDHLKCFVHHRGGVDRNLATHDPIGMGTGLLGRDIVCVNTIAAIVLERTVVAE